MLPHVLPWKGNDFIFKFRKAWEISPRITYVQYSGGCAVQRWLYSTAEGYHQYSGGISSVQPRDIISKAEGYHQYSGG